MARIKLTSVQKVGLSFGVLAIAMIGLFQNCSPGFSVDPSLGGVVQLASTTVPVLGVSNANFKSCRSGTADLYMCLEASSDVKGVLRTADVATCTAVTTTTPTDLDVAMCLSKLGFPIFNYREPLQTDIDTCAVKVGTSKIAACLLKNAILPVGVTQAAIENCVGLVGLPMVEKCLRKNSFLAKIPFISQSDVLLCTKVTDQGTNGAVLLACLTNRELLPASVVQSDIDLCITNAPGAIAKCLRSGKKVSRVLMQNNINSCVAAVGSAKAAACLDANGYLYDSLLPAATLQTSVDSCVTAAGAPATAKCLRSRGVLEKPLMQAQIASCIAAVGADKAVACLTANGLVDSVTGMATNSIAGTQILQADVDACVVAAGTGGVAKCLVTVKKVLSASGLQGNFEFCARLNDATGIAACLDGSGMLPTTTANGPATQANFDTCVAAAGLAGVETCMRTRGFIP
ncbi:hypothetical protein BH10BDE1_BH10BDE1_12570 [soil metagenome]